MPTHQEIIAHQELIRKNIGNSFYVRNVFSKGKENSVEFNEELEFNEDCEVEKALSVLGVDMEKGGPGSGRRRGGGMRTKNVGRRKFQTGIDRDRAMQSSAKSAALKMTKEAAEKAKQSAKDYYEEVKREGDSEKMESAKRNVRFYSLVAGYAKSGKST